MAAVLVVIAIGAGAAVGVVTRPAPSVEPSATPMPTATSAPDTGPLVFKQPLTAGCATDDAVWVVSDGGGIGRFDRLQQRWELIDSTLRSLVAVACGSDTVFAVGAFGRVVVIDDLAKTIHADDIGIFNAYAVSLVPDGALVVGSDGSVQRQSSTGWDKYAQGIDEDLYGVVGFAGGSAWMVGAGGVTYRLEKVGGDFGWKPYETGTTVALRTIAATMPTEAIAAGDDGVVLRFDGSWRPLESGPSPTSQRRALSAASSHAATRCGSSAPREPLRACGARAETASTAGARARRPAPCGHPRRRDR